MSRRGKHGLQFVIGSGGLFLLIALLTGVGLSGTWQWRGGDALRLEGRVFSDPNGPLALDGGTVKLDPFSPDGTRVLLFPPTASLALARYRYLRVQFEAFPSSHRVQFSWMRAGEQRAARAEAGSAVGGSVWLDLARLDRFDPQSAQLALALGPLDFKFSPSIQQQGVRFVAATFYPAGIATALHANGAQAMQFAPEALSAVNLTRLGGQGPALTAGFGALLFLVVLAAWAHWRLRIAWSAALAMAAFSGWVVLDQARLKDAYAEAGFVRAHHAGKPFALRETLAFDSDLKSFIDAFKLAWQPPDASARVFVIAQEVPTFRALYFLAPYNAAPLFNSQDHLSGLRKGDVVLFYDMFSDVIDGNQLWVNRGRLSARQVFADPRGSAFVVE